MFKGPHQLLTTLNRSVVMAIITGMLFGCVPVVPEYSDPLSYIGNNQAGPFFPNVKLGLVFSENVGESIKYLEKYRSGMASLGGLMNVTGFNDADPSYLTKEMNHVLERNFGDVIVLRDLKDTEKHDINLVMVLDFQVELGFISWDQTKVNVSGVFMSPNGTVLERIAAEGISTVGGGSFGFKPAVGSALKSFSGKLQNSGKLVAHIESSPSYSNLEITQSSGPTHKHLTLPLTDGPSSSSEKLSTNVNFGKYYALVIGNNDYQHLPKLKTAVNDAKAVANVLRDSYAFEVKLLLNGTRRNIISHLDKLRRKLTPNDNLLIYYAGHGYFDEESNRGYWLPSNAASDTSADWISNADITDKLKAFRAKHVIVVADSCYSGALTRDISIRLKTPDYLQRMARKRSRTVLSSGGLEPVLDSDGGDHSVFARAFLAALLENTGVVDGTQVFNEIRRPVAVNSPQIPQYSDIRFAGHEGGDFLFVRKE